MIIVTRLNGDKFYINPDLIEFIEETPDTVVTMTTWKKVIVEEKAEEIISRIVEFRILWGNMLNPYTKEENPQIDSSILQKGE